MVAACERMAKIEGGWVGIDAASLLHAWTATGGDVRFRAWLACHEMQARRQRGRAASCGVPELAALLGVSARTAGAAARRLVAAGLIRWDEGSIEFIGEGERCCSSGPGTGIESAISIPGATRGTWPRTSSGRSGRPTNTPQGVGRPDSTSSSPMMSPAPSSTSTRCPSVLDTISGARGPVRIPRRLLRWLCRGQPRAVIATALAALLRCVARRRSGWTSRGRFKASWVAGAFGVAARHVKAARAELVRLGWLAPEPGDQWAWNRWGRAYRVDLGWSAPNTFPEAPSRPLVFGRETSNTARKPGSLKPLLDREGLRTKSHPLPADPGAETSPPDLHPDPLREGKHPEPAGRGPAGACASGRIGEIPRGETPCRLESEATSRSRPGRSDSVPTSRGEGCSRRSTRSPGPPILPRDTSWTPGSSDGTGSPPSRWSSSSRRRIDAPTLRDIRPHDLADPARAAALHAQAVAAGLVPASEHGRQRFGAMAAHALGRGVRSPGAMMRWLMRPGNDRVLTQADEDAARRRAIKPQTPTPPGPSPNPAPPAQIQFSRKPEFASPYLGAERRDPGPSSLASVLARLPAISPG